ncbi:MAG: PAS domain S-box protein [candidate division Zixibacteria bacterium]|nr:PAS domain S-box protein [candidate division Zixibacteria bacterium]
MSSGNREITSVDNQNLLKALLDDSPILVAYLDPQFDFVRVNRAYAEAHGQDPSFYPGKNHFDLYPNEENLRIFQKVIETGRPYHVEAKPFEYEKNKERGVSWFDWRLAPVRDEGGHVTALILTMADVTGHRPTESQPEKSSSVAERTRMKLATLLRATNQVQAATTERQVLDVVAPAVHDSGWASVAVYLFKDWEIVDATFVGLSEQDIEILQSGLLSPQERSSIYGSERADFRVSKSYFIPAERRSELSLSDPIRLSSRHQQVGDTWNSCDEAYVPMYGPDSAVIGVISMDDPTDGQRPSEQTFRYLEFFADLAATTVVNLRLSAEQERVVEALLESEDKYRALFNAGQDAITVAKADDIGSPGNFVEVNDIACRMWGYSRDELLQMRPVDLRDPTVPADNARFTREMTENGHSLFERTNLHKDGNQVPVEVNSHYVHLNSRPFFVAISRDITERRLAEEALRESEEKYRVLFKTMEQGVVYQNAAGEIVSANPAAERILGLTVDQMQGRTSIDPRWKAVHEDGSDFPGETHPSMIALKTGKVVNDVIMGVFNPDTETYRWILVNAVPQFTAGDDSPTQVYTTFTDITERKRAEEALQKSTDGLLKAQHVAGMGLLDWNLQTNEVLWSDEMYRLLGVDPGEYDGSLEATVRFAHPDDQEWVKEQLDLAIRGVKPYDNDHRMLRPDGKVIWVHAQAELVCDSSGKPTNLLGTMIDITARKQAEEALAQSEDRFRKLFQLAPLGYQSLDENGSFLEVNDTWCRTLGYSREEVIGRSFAEFIDPGFKDVFERCFPMFIDAGSIDGVEHTMMKKDGSRIIASFVGRVGYNDDGTFKQTHCIFEDVTERKRAAETLKHSHDLMSYIIEHNRSCVAVHDKDLKYIYVSQRYLDEYKVQERDVIGKHHYEVFPDLPRKWRDVHQKALAGEISSAEDDPYYREDGTVDWTRWECRPWYEADGSVGGIIVYTEVITERKRAEEALRESESRHRTLFEAAGDAIFIIQVTDEGPRFIDCNPKTLEIFGCTREQMIGKSPINFSPPTQPDGTDSEKRVGEIAVAAMAGESLRFEWVHCQHDGTAFDAEVTVNRLDLAGGNYLQAMVRDVTERKQARQAIEESEQKYRKLVETSQHLIWKCDAEGKFTYLNQAWEQTLGYTTKEMMGRPFGDFQRPEIHERDTKEFARHLAGGSMKGYETSHLSKSGQDVHLVFNALPLYDSDRNIIGTQGTAYDITERTRAEAALRESEELSRAVIDHSPVGISVRSRTGQLLTYNEAWREIWKVREDDMADYETRERQSLRFDHRDDYLGDWRPKVEKIYHDGGYLFIPELEIKKSRKGRHLWISQHFYAVMDEQGDVDSVVVLTSDITQRKRAEHMLRLAVEGTSAKTGEEFFQSLVQFLSQALGMQYALIGELLPGHKEQVQTLAICAGDNIVENMVYDLTGTPCENVSGKQACVYPRDIQALFPDDVDLVKLGAESYMGTPLFSSTGSALGILVVMDTKPFSNELQDTARNLLTILGARAAAEIERVRADRALIERDYTLRESQQVASLGSYDLDVAQGKWTSSDVLNTVFGIEADYKKDIDGWLQIVHPDYREELLSYLTEEVLNKHNSFDRQYRIVRRNDGKVRWVHGMGKLEFDSEGNAIRMIGTIQDITERKQAEENVRVERDRAQKYLDIAGSILVALDTDGQVTMINRAGCEILGYAKDEIEGKDWFENFLPEEHRLPTRAVFDQLMSGHIDPVEYYENPILTKSGRERLVSWHNSVLRDKNGQITGTLASAEDITEQRLANEALRASEERFRTYISHAPDAVFIADPQGRYVDVNEAAFRLTGYSIEELTNMSITDLVDPKLSNEARARFENLKESGRTSSESRFRKKDGSLVSVSLDAVALSEGLYMAFCSDITETKRLQELESRAQRLETAGQIAGQVAHDFNNLLAPLMAYPEFIREELGTDHSALKYLDDIENASRQIADINQQLLTLGRRGHYNQEVMNLNDVVSQAVRQIESPPSTLVLVSDLAEDLMNIKGGRSQVFRAISNLLVNAREAMQDIGQITLRTENFYVDEMWINYARVPQGEYVKLTITDAGCGIPDEIRQKIFEPFFTTKTADKKRGSGLGISVVDAVIKDHDGHIDLISNMGKGTSFFLYFPVTRDTVGTQLHHEIVGGRESILIVDDDKVQRDVSIKLLGSLGYHTTAVESGEEALKVLKDHAYDLLILDMIMPPGIDGAETFRQTQLVNPEQRAIIVSGFAESDRVAAALKMGAGAFVKKPLTRRRLAAAVRDELNRVTHPA